MEYVHWRTNARLVKAYLDKSASTIEWLERQGVEFIEPAGYFPGSYSTMHRIKRRGQGHGGATLVKVLVAKAKEKGVVIRLATPVKKIVKDEDRIGGVVVEEKSGEPIQINAKAVIIATGGYGNNKEMIKKYGGFDLGHDLFMLHNLKLTGDGIQMAWEVGAAADGMGLQLAGFKIPGPGIEGALPWVTKNQLRIVQGQPYFWINQKGERFIDEGIIRNNPYAANAIARQKNRCAFVIFDRNTKEYIEKEGVDYEWSVFPGKKIVGLDAQIKKCVNEGNENIFVANSLEELGNEIGVNPNALQKTVNEYNKFCEKGYDGLFGKNPKYLQPVKQPKFYAFRVFPIAYGTVGGIKIDEKTEVLDKRDEVIPGLYAVGNDACGIYGDPPTYDLLLPGGTFGFAVNSGRIAGENALQYVFGKGAVQK